MVDWRIVRGVAALSDPSLTERWAEPVCECQEASCGDAAAAALFVARLRIVSSAWRKRLADRRFLGIRRQHRPYRAGAEVSSRPSTASGVTGTERCPSGFSTRSPAASRIYAVTACLLKKREIIGLDAVIVLAATILDHLDIRPARHSRGGLQGLLHEKSPAKVRLGVGKRLHRIDAIVRAIL